MTRITHHPSDDLLLAFVRGSLDEGRRVLVAAHAEQCRSCAHVLAVEGHLGGQRLEQTSPTPLAADAFDTIVARLDGDLGSSSPSARRKDSPYDLAALTRYELGPWRWIGPGVHRRSVSVPSDGGVRVFALKAAPGTSLPHHTHTGTELTVILKGAFAHEGGRFAVGDFDEADDSVGHRPVVEPGEDCVCLVAMEGEIKLLGLIGRILQPLVRM